MLSEKIPVAVNCLVVPRAMLGLVGDTWIESSVAVVTVRSVMPEIPPSVAVIVIEPLSTEAANPLEPAMLLTVAIVLSDELHVTDSVTFWLVLSE